MSYVYSGNSVPENLVGTVSVPGVPVFSFPRKMLGWKKVNYIARSRTKSIISMNGNGIKNRWERGQKSQLIQRKVVPGGQFFKLV